MYLQKTPDGNSHVYELQDVVNTRGNVDYLKNGTLYKNNPSQCVLVSSNSDLENLSEYNVGTIAYTAGFKNIWQKDIDGTWIEV